MRKLLSAVMVMALTGCAAAASYDKWAEDTNRKISSGYTELLMGKQTVEYSPSMPKGMQLNIAYRLGEGKGLPGKGTSSFYNKLSGDVTYDRDCKRMMTFDVGIFNQEGALIRTEAVFVQAYDAGVKAMIEKDVETDPTKSHSSKVGKLVIKNFKCL